MSTGPSTGPSTGLSPELSTVDTTPRQLWRRIRGPLLIIGLIVVTGIGYAIATSRATGGPMDPRSAQDHGARALSVLLEERGVEVERVDRLDAALAAKGPDATLLITVPDLLTDGQAERVTAGSGHLVLFEPGERLLSLVAAGRVLPAGDTFSTVQDPDCGLRAAERAGPVDVRGRMYRATVQAAGQAGPGGVVAGGGASGGRQRGDRQGGHGQGGHGQGGGEGRTQVCYGDSTRGAVVRLTEPDGSVLDVVGTPSSFSNEELATEGNAALALNLLGERSRLVWYIPSPADLPAPGDAGRQRTDLWSLLPAGVRFGAGTVLLAAVLLMLAAARRLGPVVPEALPVVVRASEAAEGRARLYRRSRARGQAAAALVRATRSRLNRRVGLPPGAGEEELGAAVEARTGRPAAEVARLLGEQDPRDDGELVRLADALDALEQEVRRS